MQVLLILVFVGVLVFLIGNNFSEIQLEQRQDKNRNLSSHSSSSNEKFRSFVIPYGTTDIKDYEFKYHYNLTSITIPNSVTSIGMYAFWGCRSLKSFNGKFASSDGRCLIKDGELIAFAPAELTSYNIPNGVISIGDYAFRDCSSLTSITIPSSVTSIGNYAFQGCSSLTSITIGNGVKNIGNYAFWGCCSLINVTVENFTHISERAFEGCSSLKSFNGKFASSDGRCLIKNGEIIAFAPAGLTSYTISNGVKSIGNYAFQGCSSLASITVSRSVTSIGCEAFYGCSNLTSITIGNGVKSIGDYAFRSCSSLTSITIPKSVTSIGCGAFYGCSNLTSINIPKGTKVHKDAFTGCHLDIEITEY